jgi:hypothetical protein
LPSALRDGNGNDRWGRPTQRTTGRFVANSEHLERRLIAPPNAENQRCVVDLLDRPLHHERNTFQRRRRITFAKTDPAVTRTRSSCQFTSDPLTFVQSHVANIASGNVAGLAADYRPEAFLWWVGGPLDGFYGSSTAIAGTWKKFAGQGPFKATIGPVTVAGNPAGQTVVADVTYAGPKATISVRQVMLVRAGHLQDEIWQIDPGGIVYH